MAENNPEDNFIIVIRSSEERTFEICRRLLERQASPDQVTFVKLTPFKAALEECFRIGINSKKKWLITADADMLVLPNTVDLLVQQAKQMPDNYLQLQGKIFDKITGSIRKAGPRIYRIKYLPKALEYSLNTQDNIRPEGSLVTALGKQGMPSRYISAVTAYHDFEQYYKDLYRKAYVHAIKHQNLSGEIIQRCIENRSCDMDYHVIMKAIWDGLKGGEKVSIDTNLFAEKSEKALLELGIKEKEPLAESENSDQLLETVQKKNHLDETGTIYYYDQPSKEKSIRSDFFRILERDGAVKGALHGFGVFLVKVGSKLKINDDI